MNAPGGDALPLIETLRAELPAAIASGAVPGAEGWSLRDVRTERVFDRAVATLTFVREGHSLRAHLFPMHALADPYARVRHFDLYHRDDLLAGHEPAAQALLDGLMRWLDRALAEARDVSFVDPSAPEAPEAPPETAAVLATLRERLPALLATDALAGWSLARVGVERFQRLHVPRVDLARGPNALRLFLLPRGTEETCHFRTERFDMVYDEDARGSTYARNHAAMERIVAWLEETFPAAPPAPPAPPRTPEERLAHAVGERLGPALRDGALPELAGWSFTGAAAEPFRDAPTPTLRLARDGRAIALRLLPSGAEPAAVLRTDRFDIVYDDDARGTTFTRDHEALEALARWLGDAFPADAPQRPKPRRFSAPGADEATRRAEAEAASIHDALGRALAAGELPELAGWALEGVALEAFRDADVPTARLAQGGETLRVRLLPASPDSGAHFRTERFDLLYDDADQALFARHHERLERLTRWLGDAFPLGESEHARELARRRALRARQLQAPDELVGLADALDARLRGDIAAGAFAPPEGWRFDGVAVDQQQGVTAPAARFVHGDRPFVLRVLPTAPERPAALRTARYDVIYDSQPGDWQLQDEPVARAFVAWLEAAFPADAPADANPPADAPADAGDAKPAEG